MGKKRKISKSVNLKNFEIKCLEDVLSLLKSIFPGHEIYLEEEGVAIILLFDGKKIRISNTKNEDFLKQLEELGVNFWETLFEALRIQIEMFLEEK